MDWKQLLSITRYGQEARKQDESKSVRSEFQRDYDRLIFSSPFRRMQNKTQVFPLPGSVFVHNRLTHSLEVASIGRSLGHMVSEKLLQQPSLSDIHELHEIGTIVATACLAHDMGNPPFGHSGEKAISSFFEKGEGRQIIEDYELTPQQKNDIIRFEGNANALRLLTHQFKGRRFGGFSLTYTTLAGLIKYPYPSVNDFEKNKYGFFQTEQQTFSNIAGQLNLKKLSEGHYARHPLVHLVEAADDISYLIMDLEDAQKLSIIDTPRAKNLLLDFHTTHEKQHINKVLKEVTDANEQISYLRAITINKLAQAAADVFLNNHDEILEGTFEGSIINRLENHLKNPMEVLRDVGFAEIYKHRKVVEIELAGFNILETLVREFTLALQNPDSKYYENILKLVPGQFRIYDRNPYERLRSVIDYISGMTDLYALEIYRTITGIEMPSLR
ncbi:MAG: deoxyguanosinetriphosphate triphosphohydrolase [Bacteroidales bacterium]|nr:deoxyguanosinetriphosphate triphosphohydrolase [Bacteroidales bacterium]